MTVIDEDGINLGIMNKKAALRLAEEKHLELIQVSCHLAGHTLFKLLQLFRCIRVSRRLCVV